MGMFEPVRWSGGPARILRYLALFELALAAVFAALALAVEQARVGFLITAGVLGVAGLAMWQWSVKWQAGFEQAQRVRATGLSGEASVLSMTQTGAYLNEQPQVELDLEVRVPGRAPYRVQRREWVPLIMLGRLTNGWPLPVKVDPNDANNVVIEWQSAGGMPSGPWGQQPGMPAAGFPQQQGGFPAAAGGGPTLAEIDRAAGAAGMPDIGNTETPAGQIDVEALRAHVRQNGIPGTLTIESVRDSGRDVGNDHMFQIDGTIQVPGQPLRRTSETTLVPKPHVNRVVRGATIPVKVAPENPGVVLIEWERA